MTRRDFQQLARLRLREARLLLDNDFPQGAYYLAGYAVECAIKARIARQIQRHEFPDKALADQAWQHDLPRLLNPANLQGARNAEEQASAAFARNWTTVKDWKVESRYDPAITARKAQDLYDAIVDRRSGVMRWLRQHW